MKYKGAIFDMDGLLFDTEIVYQQMWREIAGERGIRLPADFVKAISGTSGSHMCRVIEAYYGTADGSIIMEECMARVRKRLEADIRKKPGVDEILRCFLEHGIRLAVASSSNKEQIERNLQKAGIRFYFEDVISGKEVACGKPAPDIFFLAAERIGCRPEECYVFEDSENGIRAGKAAGMRAIMIPDLIAPTEEMRKLSDGIYVDLRMAMRAIL